jgi:hypothetical protein
MTSHSSPPAPAPAPEGLGCPSFQVISSTFFLTSPTFLVSFSFPPLPLPPVLVLGISFSSAPSPSAVESRLIRFFLVARGVGLGLGVGSLYRSARVQGTRGKVSTAQNQDPEEIGNRFLGVCPRSECRMKCEGRLTNDPSRARLTPVCSAHQLMTHDSSKDESDRASPDLTYPSCAREYRSCPGGAPSPLYPLAACLVMIDG